VDSQDPRQLLAQRLRGLREDRKITQPQLAAALGGSKPLSVPLISSWESQTNPHIPPPVRLEGYAAVFATSRSFDGAVPRRLSSDEMTDEERRAMTELRQELMQLRSNAMRAAGSDPASGAVRPFSEAEKSLSSGFWRYADGNDITIVCARWPAEMLEKMLPYTDSDHPDYIELLTCSELDSLFELYGHLRAANPGNQVNLRLGGKLAADDFSSHLISLGGVDWNSITSTTMQLLPVPVQQVANWDTSGEQYFQVDENGGIVKHRPELQENAAQPLEADAAQPKEILRGDVALFARGISPFNRKRTVTICNGMYNRGTYGVVRALTDARFRDRNSEYLRTRFGNNDTYCILTRVSIVNGTTLTPDWTTGDDTLFEWPG
jgi:transcriptional regulator with XRE-family HTH domain